MPEKFSVRSETQSVDDQPVGVFRLQGTVDASATSDLDEQFSAVADNGARHFVFDFAGVQYISSAGLRLLLRFRKTALDAGGDIRVCGLRRDIRENVFEALGFARLIRLCVDVDEALASFTGGRPEA
ncbi:MAG: STAS domain-containing protein [Planctomycetota bacterium]